MFDWDGLHLGDLPTWLAAFFTGGAFAVGFWVLVLQRQDLNDREKDRLREVEDRRSEQARHVAAWCTQVRTNVSGIPAGYSLVDIAYYNGGGEPVYDASIDVRSGWGDQADMLRTPVGVIPPGRPENSFNVEMILQLGEAPQPPNDKPPIVMFFRDAANQWWKRGADGPLTAVEAENHLATSRQDARGSIAQATTPGA